MDAGAAPGRQERGVAVMTPNWFSGLLLAAVILLGLSAFGVRRLLAADLAILGLAVAVLALFLRAAGAV